MCKSNRLLRKTAIFRAFGVSLTVRFNSLEADCHRCLETSALDGYSVRFLLKVRLGRLQMVFRGEAQGTTRNKVVREPGQTESFIILNHPKDESDFADRLKLFHVSEAAREKEDAGRDQR